MSYEWIQTGRHVCRFLDIDDDRLDALKTEALDIISESSGPVA
jgi:hypothetical protein